jgi:hypothetical protein
VSEQSNKAWSELECFPPGVGATDDWVPSRLDPGASLEPIYKAWNEGCLRFTILDVEKGDKFSDICISALAPFCTERLEWCGGC